MHKQAMEMAKWAMADACAKGYDCMTSQDWDDFKDCMETAKNAIKADYYYHLVCEMKDMEKYKLSAEEYKNRTAEELRDMDKKTRNVMYFSEPMKADRTESRYDKAKRGYTETKELHKGDTQEDNRENMRGLEELLSVIGGDLKEVFPKMSQSEKAMTAQKLDAWSKMLKQ